MIYMQIGYIYVNPPPPNWMQMRL